MEPEWADDLREVLTGEVHTDAETLEEYSTDASIFEVEPKVVVYPHDVEDVKNLINFVRDNKEEYPELSVTARAAGTDMSGGPLNESIICVFTKYFNHIKSINKSDHSAIVEPGVYYRDFEEETLKRGLYFPSYPASKSICALGGMIANNSGGERSLNHGKTQDNVNKLKVVLRDGNEYIFEPLSEDELEEKKDQDDLEGEIYREIHDLIEENEDLIKDAAPPVSKNSAGYYLWNVWDGETFDLTQLFVGSQGTLGFWTEAELNLVEKKEHSRLVAAFLQDLGKMTEFVNLVLPFEPESLETFDDETLKLGLKFMPEIAEKVDKSFLSLMWEFRREAWITLTNGFPKFVVLVELTGDDLEEVEEQEEELHEVLDEHEIPNVVMHSEEEGNKYWTIRRESFNLLRNKVSGKRATPFIDDFCVKPEDLPEFLPKMYDILEEHDISPTLAGHAGSGNFHIIPLMDLSQKSVREKIPAVSEKVYDLIGEYDGSITAEHNDGLIRTTYLDQMFGEEMTELFGEVKDIFDPDRIFNPGKKVDGDWDYSMEHMKKTV